MVCGCVMILDQVHITCTVNIETQLLLVLSLNATETWVQDIEQGLMLFRFDYHYCVYVYNYKQFNSNVMK